MKLWKERDKNTITHIFFQAFLAQLECKIVWDNNNPEKKLLVEIVLIFMSNDNGWITFVSWWRKPARDTITMEHIFLSLWLSF